MNNVALVCRYVKHEALHYCLSGAIVSCSCTLKQQTRSYWPFLLLHLVLESDKNASQNEMTAFRTWFVSRGYGVRSTQHSTAPVGETNQKLSEGNLVSKELSLAAISSWQDFHLSGCWQFGNRQLACYLFKCININMYLKRKR